MGSAMRRAVVVTAVAAVSAVGPVPAASALTMELSGFCRIDGFRGYATMIYELGGGGYRPIEVTGRSGPHLGETEPLSASVRLQVVHVAVGATKENVDFDKTRARLRTGVPVSEPVGGVTISVTATMRVKAAFTFVKPGGETVNCSVVKEA